MSEWKLHANPRFGGPHGPVILAVLDGVGIGKKDEADAVFQASTPTMDQLWHPDFRCALKAHGTAVGLPSDGDMGNSEVGHNALGCGRVYSQGAKLVNAAIGSGSMFEGEAWTQVVERCKKHNSALHFIGLLSDGNVHSHIDHLIAMLKKAASQGINKLYVHCLLDGRDVAATSALKYVDQLENILAELRESGNCDAKIASGGGRMVTTMDRYQADWSIVERGYNAHVHGDARAFSSATEAIETFRAESRGIGDQYLPAFVIAEEGNAVAPMRDGDAAVFFNFRGDRAIEISQAFEAQEFPHFDRGQRPKVLFSGMMEYDGDLKVPGTYLVEPPAIERTMGEYLARNQVSQFAISETQKFGHVTYFWNGNRSEKFDDSYEAWKEVPSDTLPFEERPWMKAAEITDALITEVHTNAPRFVRLNYANGDMVGHTGEMDAARLAVECVDRQLARLAKLAEETKGILIVTADHGNADEMYQRDKAGQVLRDSQSGRPVVKTSHTLSPVPLMIYAPRNQGTFVLDPQQAIGAGIPSVTTTTLELLGFTAPEDFAPTLLRYR